MKLYNISNEFGNDFKRVMFYRTSMYFTLRTSRPILYRFDVIAYEFNLKYRVWLKNKYYDQTT